MSVVASIEKCLTQIESWVVPGVVKGAVAVVWYDGNVAASRYAGESQPGQPVNEATLYSLASVTKPVTGAVVMSLVDRGRLTLDEPVARWLPELAAPSTAPDADPATESRRNEITARQLLAHLSGMAEDLPPRGLKMRDQPTLDQITDAMAAVPLVHMPGEVHLYSNSGYAMLGRLVERITNRHFWEIANEEILTPLGMGDSHGTPPESVDDRIAIVDDTARKGSPSEAYNGTWWRDLGTPWAGLVGSAVDLVTFAASFIDVGANPLSISSIYEMITDQVNGRPGQVQSLKVAWPTAWWGLGWEVKGAKKSHWTGNLTSPGTYCHFGGTGTLLWGDPSIGLAAAIFANRTTVSGWPFSPPRWATLCDCLVSAVRAD